MAKETKNGAERIWNLIKDLSFDIFSLPNQVVSQYITREEKMEKVYPDTLCVLLRAPAVKPYLEDLLGKIKLANNEQFEFGQIHNYFTIKIV